MFGNKSNPLRPLGVRIPTEQNTGAGKPQTLEHVYPMKFFGLQYVDETGRRRRMVVAEMFGQFYAAPNSEEWALRLKPLSKWLTDQIKKRADDQKPVEIPSQDAVNIFGDGDEDDDENTPVSAVSAPAEQQSDHPIAERIKQEAIKKGEEAR